MSDQIQIIDGYYQYAFLSAFTTLPSFQPTGEFYNKEILKLFNEYKIALDTMKERSTDESISDANPDYTHVYRPIPYCLFGDFDMAIFSLIDDFSFATQKFKPSPGTEGYKYQINTGIIPLIEAYHEDNPQMPKFRDQTVQKFFTEEDFYPYTGIASIKLNNAMLVGLGQDFMNVIEFFLITFLDRKKEKLEGDGKKLFYILNENLGWNELTIYFFGSSIFQMQELLLELRQFRLRDIHERLQGFANTKYNEAKIERILSVFPRIETEALLGKMINKMKGEALEKGENCEIDYLESHPIMATSITYGFHIDMISLCKNEVELEKKCDFKGDEFTIFKKEYEEQCCITIGWKIKPGHELAAEKMLKSLRPKQQDFMLKQSRTGKYPFIFPNREITIREFLEFSNEIENLPQKTIARNIVKLRSRMQWGSEVPYQDFDEHKHYEYDLKDYQFSPPRIKRLQNLLRIAPIPHIYKSQIENLIINYNDAVGDPLMYNYFIGLREPLLNFIRDTLRPAPVPKADELESTSVSAAGRDTSNIKRKKIQLVEVHVEAIDPERISNFIQAWNKAYWNRYFHSYYFTEINDFNIEHHGGIQQLLFTYDVIYKLIARRIYGVDSKVPFVNVQVSHEITSTQYFNSINFTHLFRPAIYACGSVHEAANHIVSYLIQRKDVKGFDFLFNPKNDVVEPDKLVEFQSFQSSLHKRIAPREKFEILYLEEDFGMNAVRHIVVDFATYILGYVEPDKMNTAAKAREFDEPRMKMFYHTHWFLFLVRADLYFREVKHTGGWYFNVNHFRTLFIRFNLMFYIFFDFTEQQLAALNEECPSIELNALWQSEKDNLLDFTKRLGNALKDEFTERLRDQNIDTGKLNGFHYFREKIETLVFDENWELLGSDQEIYKKAIANNQKLISGFYELFKGSENKENIIIRHSQDIESTPFPSNVSFYKPPAGRDIFLDPKGNLFTTSPDRRLNVFENNVKYIKTMWDLSLKIVIRDYAINWDDQ